MAVWKEENNWVYEHFDASCPAEEFPGFQDLVALWQEKRGSRAAPSWKDFDFYDFKGWHGSLILFDYFYEPFDFEYVLFGSKIAERMGIDVTGKRATELVNSHYETSYDFDFYEMAGRNLKIVKVTRDLVCGAPTATRAVFVELPLSDDGKIANKYLTALLWEDYQ